MREPYTRKTAKAVRTKSTSNTTTGVKMKNASVSINKIQNGYLVHHSGERNGKFISKTTFSPTNPVKISKG